MDKKIRSIRESEWQESQLERARQLRKKGVKVGEIAEEVGRSEKSVSGLFYRDDLHKKPKGMPEISS